MAILIMNNIHTESIFIEDAFNKILMEIIPDMDIDYLFFGVPLYEMIISSFFLR